MNFCVVSPPLFNRIRSYLITFTTHYSEDRITYQAIRWLKKLKQTELKEGTMIIIAVEGKKLIGLIAFGNYGINESFCVVHPKYRNRGIGERLLKHSLQHLNRVYTRVATDNIPSLKVCFASGLVAFRLLKGPTGKPTIIFGGGDWKQDEMNNLS